MREIEKALKEVEHKMMESMGKKRQGLTVAYDIILKHMNDGWIPVEERLPVVPDNLDDDECPEFNVTIKGCNRATTLRCASDGTWFDEFGHIYPVIAWRPLPDTYQPDEKRS